MLGRYTDPDIFAAREPWWDVVAGTVSVGYPDTFKYAGALRKSLRTRGLRLPANLELLSFLPSTPTDALFIDGPLWAVYRNHGRPHGQQYELALPQQRHTGTFGDAKSLWSQHKPCSFLREAPEDSDRATGVLIKLIARDLFLGAAGAPAWLHADPLLPGALKVGVMARLWGAASVEEGTAEPEDAYPALDARTPLTLTVTGNVWIKQIHREEGTELVPDEAKPGTTPHVVTTHITVTGRGNVVNTGSGDATAKYTSMEVEVLREVVGAARALAAPGVDGDDIAEVQAAVETGELTEKSRNAARRIWDATKGQLEKALPAAVVSAFLKMIGLPG
jgi:hypothetical protein